MATKTEKVKQTKYSRRLERMVRCASLITLKFPAVDPRKLIINRLANSHPKLTRGVVWCKTCGATKDVAAERCLARGWPKCCGETMTIDSPEEQELLGASNIGSELPTNDL